VNQKLADLGRFLEVSIWVTDITYIRTLEGFAYLAVVIDLYSRRVVGWSMQSRQTTDLVLQALLMAVWRRKPKTRVLIHSDQGSQFTSMDWASFLRAHNLEPSMSRRGNCHDNAVAESFFNLLKRERIRRRTYKTRVEARQDVFDYIEMFYNPKRKHVRNGMLSPVEFERQQKMSTEGVQKTQGCSVDLIRFRILQIANRFPVALATGCPSRLARCRPSMLRRNRTKSAPTGEAGSNPGVVMGKKGTIPAFSADG
jgi:hypothetical protein